MVVREVCSGFCEEFSVKKSVMLLHMKYRAGACAYCIFASEAAPDAMLVEWMLDVGVFFLHAVKKK